MRKVVRVSGSPLLRSSYSWIQYCTTALYYYMVWGVPQYSTPHTLSLVDCVRILFSLAQFHTGKCDVDSNVR